MWEVNLKNVLLLMDVGDELEERTFTFVSTKSLHIISRDEIIPSEFE